MSTILLDAGPIVALFNSRERAHGWVKEQVAALKPPLLTCEAVLTEACFLLARAGGNPLWPLKALEQGTFIIGMRLSEEATAVRSLFERYGNVPASLADACLIRMSELYEPCLVMTLDSDFHIYRRHGRRSIPLLMPDVQRP